MDDQFNSWVAMWEKSQGDMPKVPAMRKANPETSFFGMNSVNDDDLEAARARDIDAWKDIDARTSQLNGRVDSHELFMEAKKEEEAKKKGLGGKKKVDDGSNGKKKKKSATDSTHDEADPDDTEGIGAILAKALGDKDQFVSPNPIHFASVGMDQKLRVTPNWTSGSALMALAKLKIAMFDLECEMLSAEATGGKNVAALESRLEGLQKQFHVMSQKVAPDTKNDVS
jgi:hypothetical protein